MFYLMELENVSKLEYILGGIGQVLGVLMVLGLWVSWLWEDESEHTAREALPMVAGLSLLGGALAFLHPGTAMVLLAIFIVSAWIALMFKSRRWIQDLRRRHRDMLNDMRYLREERDLLIKRMGGEGLVPLVFDWRWKLHYLRTGRYRP